MKEYRFLFCLIPVFTLAVSFGSAQDYSLKQVEPPFWYTGMKHQQLQIMHYSPADGLYVYFRYNRNKKVMVALNKSEKPATINPLLYPEMLGGVISGLDILTGKSGAIANWVIPGKSPAVIELR